MILGDRPILIDGFRQHCIHPFQYAFSDTERLAQPSRGDNNQDLCDENSLAQAGPFVAVALFGTDIRVDFVIRHANDIRLNALIYGLEENSGQHFDVGNRAWRCGCSSALKRAYVHILFSVRLCACN